MMDNLVQKMNDVWISCPLCSVSFKQCLLKDDVYLETDLCALCKLLCEKCEEKPSVLNSNLCRNCSMQLNINYEYLGDLINNNTLIDEQVLQVDNTQEIIQITNDENVLNIETFAKDKSKLNFKPCLLIDKLYNKHPVDSVNAPINGTIGNRSIEIILEGLVDFIDEKTVILDLGSGSGKTVTKFATVLNCSAVGIECDKLRHECSMVNLSTILKHVDVNITFIHGDIETYFESFNGYSIIYMFDTAYPPKIIQKIMELFNKSNSIKAIVCNSKLDKIGFNVTLFRSLGSLTAGNTNRTFYIYRSNIISDIWLLDEQNEKDIQFSRSSTRIEFTKTTSSGFLNKSRNDTSIEQHTRKELYALLQKSPTLIKCTMFVKFDQVVGSTDKQSCYTVFNRQDLSLTNKFEYRAVTWNSKYFGIITPCYDGDGEILVSIIHYTVGPQYDAIIFNIKSETFRKISVRCLFDNLQFDYKIPFPEKINLVEMMVKYRKEYPLKGIEPIELISGPRKRKTNEVFSPDVVITKRVTSAAKLPVASTETKFNNDFIQLKDKLNKLEEENKNLKRKTADFERETKKAKACDNINVAAFDRISSIEIALRDKERDNDLKLHTLQNANDIQALKLDQEREMRKIKKDTRAQDREREREERERIKLMLHEERQANKIREIEMNRLRETRELDLKAYQQSQEVLFNRIIDIQEDKYHDVRSDAKMYHEKLLDLTNNIVEKFSNK